MVSHSASSRDFMPRSAAICSNLGSVSGSSCSYFSRSRSNLARNAAAMSGSISSSLGATKPLLAMASCQIARSSNDDSGRLPTR